MKRHERGQSLVEFALILPIFVLVMVSVFDLGHVVWSNDAMSNAAREAVRYAIVRGGAESTACPVGPTERADIPLPSTDCPYPSPSKQGIKDVAINWARASATNISVSVCYGDVTTCVGDTDATGAVNSRGTRVTVTVTAHIGVVMPSFFGIESATLTSTSTMLVNH